MNKVTIHRGIAEDIPALFSLVQELAIYEKAGDEVITSVDIYERDWGEGIFEFQTAKTPDGEVVGIILYYMTYSTWKGKMLYLEDFVVKQDYRHQGIGEILFQTFLDEAKNKGCKVVKWQVLDWNTPAINFYKKHHAIIEKEWWNGKIIFDSEQKDA